ncbi:MAG: hypothetical protein JXQ96_13690 [Cyclobacteriaceae bacterium]
MKLTEELKNKIDNYFDNISPEELYRVSSIKYGFSEDLSFEIKSEKFNRVHVDNYVTNLIFSNDQVADSNTLPLAA